MTTPPPPDTPGTKAIEDRVRAALHAAANSITSSPDGLNRIEANLMPAPSFNPQQRKALTIASVAAAVLLVVVGIVALTQSDDDNADLAVDDTATTTTPTTAATTTTSTTAATTTTATPTTSAPPNVDRFAVVYPAVASDVRYTDPRGLAEDYARQVLGFTELVVGEYQAGDSRSGEVPISDERDGSPTSTVLVRQFDDDNWYVLGSISPDITVDAPTSGAALASPFQTTGSALAFEGTVDVAVVVAGQADPVGTGFVTGNGTPPAGPFDDRISFVAPGPETPGVVVYRTLSAEDGHVIQATSVRVRLTDAGE